MSSSNFKLVSDYKPTGDQPEAIEKLTANLLKDEENQVLLGVTGSGKTFTVANVIQNIQKPTLVIAHNKTLAAQLYQEFKEFFPNNAVSYFVSYYDFYQPEAYLPQTDTYIEKETEINEEIDKLRLAATTNLLTRKDVIVVASVSCIYNLGSPEEYGNAILALSTKLERKFILEKLADLQYLRNEFSPTRGTFRVRGESIDIFPSYDDFGIRWSDKKIEKIEAISGKVLETLDSYVLYPAKHYITDPTKYKSVFDEIRKDLEVQLKNLKPLEANRLKSRVTYDLEMINELGYVNGIENYSRYFDGRKPGDPPYSLLEFFPKDYLLIIDESHMTIPQIRGMYNGDQSRKQTLIDFGFRLPAALDNRPLRFDEFKRRQGKTIYISATPDEYELSISSVTEQLVRPTGLVDPEIEIRPTKDQIQDLIKEIRNKIANKQRVLITTLTKRLAEDISGYLEDQDLKVAYLHSDIQTQQRTEILKSLRLGEYDVLVGINLLREGLDLPEVGLVAILDADKEGFLRSRTTLIQTMGRAARHLQGNVIMYADTVTKSMQGAIGEVKRRRKYQLEFNKKHNITPVSIVKPIRENLPLNKKPKTVNYIDIDYDQLIPEDKEKTKKILEKRMKEAAKILDFEGAAFYRDKLKQLAF